VFGSGINLGTFLEQSDRIKGARHYEMVWRAVGFSFLSSKGILGTVGNHGIQSGSGINFGTFLEQSDRIKGARHYGIGSWCREQLGFHI